MPEQPIASPPGRRFNLVGVNLSLAQQKIHASPAKRKMLKCGRQFGKTWYASYKTLEVFGQGLPVLYGVPTVEQLESWWFNVKGWLQPLIDAKILKANETEHSIERPGTRQQLKGKTVWNADSLRGGNWALVILDEFQLMSEDTWERVGQPMLLPFNGDALFIFTPPSLQSMGISKARDPLHASKFFRAMQSDQSGIWECFHFTSLDNPHLPRAALELMARGMSLDAYRKEILAEDEELEASRLVFSAFRDQTQLIDDFPIPETWPVLVGHDFGQANPAALFWAQNPGPHVVHNMMPGDLVAFKEYLPGPGKSIAQHVEAFQQILPRERVMKAAGGNQNTEDEIRQGYTAHGWRIDAPRCTKPATQLDRVLGLMQRNRMFVFRSLLGYREELASATWAFDSDGKRLDKVDHESRWHLSAACRYILSDLTPETVVTERKFARVKVWR